MLVLVVRIDTTAENIAAIRDAIATMESASRAEAGCSDYTFAVELPRLSKARCPGLRNLYQASSQSSMRSFSSRG